VLFTGITYVCFSAEVGFRRKSLSITGQSSGWREACFFVPQTIYLSTLQLVDATIVLKRQRSSRFDHNAATAIAARAKRLVDDLSFEKKYQDFYDFTK
jgi:hypothetical protein